MRQGDGFEVRVLGGEVEEPEFLRRLAELSKTPGRDTLIGRVLLTEEVVNIGDVAADLDYDPELKSLMSYRAILGVPLRRGDAVIGGFSLTRRERGEFTRSQVELVETFADQAVVAIENTRLFGEIQEALQRETATSEILRVISQSPTDARPVFDSIVLAAARSLRCDRAVVLLRDGDVYIHTTGATPQGPMTDFPRDRVPIDPSANFPSRAILARETLYLPDWSQISLPDHERKIQAAFGVNSALYLPLLREGECIGLIVLLGTRPNLFGPKEIAQAESFRDQALIAMENARLFDEVQAKTRDLEESLQQQTATADVLRVISRSAFDLQTVLDTLITSAVKMIGAAAGVIALRNSRRPVCRDSIRYASTSLSFERWHREF